MQNKSQSEMKRGAGKVLAMLGMAGMLSLVPVAMGQANNMDAMMKMPPEQMAAMVKSIPPQQLADMLSKVTPQQMALVMAKIPREKLETIAVALTPDQLVELASKVPPQMMQVIIGGLGPKDRERLMKRLTPAQQAKLARFLGQTASVGGGQQLERMFINLKNWEIKVPSAADLAKMQEMLRQAEEAGQSPYFPGGKYLLGRMELVKIPAGSFLMGSNPSEAGHMADEERHEVQLTKPFWMGCFEVTQEQWKLVMGTEDKTDVTNRPAAGTIEIPTITRGAGYPMFKVSYEDAKLFCSRLTKLVRSAKPGKGAFVLPENMEFSLPTEAQWEYACRAGTQSAFFSGEVLLARDASYHIGQIRRQEVKVEKKNNDNGDGMPPDMGMEGEQRQKSEVKVQTRVETYTPVVKPVGSCNPNAFGLYDMHGSVWEWCKGGYYTYTSAKETDPRGGSPSSPLGVARGGSWYSMANDCRSARRNDLDRKTRQDNIGFRVVITVK